MHRQHVVGDVHRGRARLAARRDHLAGRGDAVFAARACRQHGHDRVIRLAGGCQHHGQVVGVVHLQVSAAVPDRVHPREALAQCTRSRRGQAGVGGLLHVASRDGLGRRGVEMAATGEQRRDGRGQGEVAKGPNSTVEKRSCEYRKLHARDHASSRRVLRVTGRIVRGRKPSSRYVRAAPSARRRCPAPRVDGPRDAVPASPLSRPWLRSARNGRARRARTAERRAGGPGR